MGFADGLNVECEREKTNKQTNKNNTKVSV